MNIDGQNVELKQDNAQKIYDDLEQRITEADNQLSSLETQIAALRQQNSDLLDENKNFESYGTDALVSTNKILMPIKPVCLRFCLSIQVDGIPMMGL